MVPNITPIMENQMEKNMENEMQTGIIGQLIVRENLSYSLNSLDGIICGLGFREHLSCSLNSLGGPI